MKTKQNNLAPVAENSGPSDYETDALPTVLKTCSCSGENETEDTGQQNAVLKPDWMDKLQSASMWSANDMWRMSSKWGSEWYQYPDLVHSANVIYKKVLLLRNTAVFRASRHKGPVCSMLRQFREYSKQGTMCIQGIWIKILDLSCTSKITSHEHLICLEKKILQESSIYDDSGPDALSKNYFQCPQTSLIW